MEIAVLNKDNKSQLSKILLLRKKISFIERTLGMMSRAVQDFVSRNNFVNITVTNTFEYFSGSPTSSIEKDEQLIYCPSYS